VVRGWGGHMSGPCSSYPVPLAFHPNDDKIANTLNGNIGYKIVFSREFGQFILVKARLGGLAT
jgi:hypothetical protein